MFQISNFEWIKLRFHSTEVDRKFKKWKISLSILDSPSALLVPINNENKILRNKTGRTQFVHWSDSEVLTWVRVHCVIFSILMSILEYNIIHPINLIIHVHRSKASFLRVSLVFRFFSTALWRDFSLNIFLMKLS